MRIPHLISLLILLVVCTLPATAQLSPGKPAANPESSLKIPPETQTFSCNAVASPGSQAVTPLRQKELCGQAKQEISSAMKDFAAQQTSACYTMRDYLFDNKKSAAAIPKLKDYSTCESASLFHELEVTAPKK